MVRSKPRPAIKRFRWRSKRNRPARSRSGAERVEAKRTSCCGSGSSGTAQTWAEPVLSAGTASKKDHAIMGGNKSALAITGPDLFVSREKSGPVGSVSPQFFLQMPREFWFPGEFAFPKQQSQSVEQMFA